MKGTRQKAIMLTLLAFALIGSATWVALAGSKPLRHSSAKIRMALLRETPLGTSIEVVTSHLRANGLTPELNNDVGFYRGPWGQGEVVGRRHIRVHMGTYRKIPFFLKTDVDAFYGFGEEGTLIDIWVKKDVDAL